MNKAQLIDYVSIRADITKAAAARAMDELCKAITQELAEGRQLQLVGFGTFKTNSRAARAGRNPRSGETIQIAAAKVPAFNAGKALKDACK